MRPSDDQVSTIREEFRAIFGPDDAIYLFGSRVDDDARGGDIDIFIETELPPDEALDREMRLYARLQRRLGERRIDIVTHSAATPLRSIHKSAKATGVRL